MVTEFLTWGQQIALDQLSEIAAASDGAIEIVQTELPSSDEKSLFFRLSIETCGYEFQEGGFKFRQREPLRVFVSANFPICPPSVRFAHQRFLGCAHVQWGDTLCLYQATDVEWVASDGMFGFIKRLDEWLCDAARNQLDPIDAPLHPPSEYPSSEKRFAVEIDTPELVEGSLFWIGAAKLTKRSEYCYDISEWTETPSTLPEKEIFAAVVLLNQSMPMEYPSVVSKLISSIEDRGIPFKLLFSILKVFALCQGEDDPVYFLLGAPMRRRRAGEPLRQHLTVWKIASEYCKALRAIVMDKPDEATVDAWKLILNWATEAKTEWCRVYDNRPEVTFRRDQNTPASWFLDKSVVLLGCGAIGSYIGEYLIRAGVSKLLLVDYSTIKPGILVRQQFKHYQVGYSKQSGLARQLQLINPKADIAHEFVNLVHGWPDAIVLNDFDLVVDATASRRVAAALQLDWNVLESTPPVLRCSISGDASKGIASLKMPMAKFGPADLIRQTKLIAFNTPALSDFSYSFWPLKQLESGFQPEPGCSEPTFVGSVADIAFFASSFFNFAAHALKQEPNDTATAFFVTAANSSQTMSSQIISLGEADFTTEVCYGYRVYLSPIASKAIESEIKSSARTGSPRDETGGLLLGEIDDSLRSISVDIATGPPPDSKKSPNFFLCGIEGTNSLCEYYAKKSGNSTKFIGVWHTHPFSMPEPSVIDIQAMIRILNFQEKTPRHVVMLIVGQTDAQPIRQFYLFRRSKYCSTHGLKGKYKWQLSHTK